MKLTSITYTIANQVLRAVKTPFSREAEMAQMSMLSEVEVWLSVDPLAEDYPGWSPYNYTMQNPVKLVDPDGRRVVEKNCPNPPCSHDYEGPNRDQVDVLIDYNESEPTSISQNNSSRYKSFFQQAKNYGKKVLEKTYSLSNKLDRRISSKGEGLNLYYSEGNGSDGMYLPKGRRSDPLDVDVFLDNAIMPGGSGGGNSFGWAKKAGGVADVTGPLSSFTDYFRGNKSKSSKTKEIKYHVMEINNKTGVANLARI